MILLGNQYTVKLTRAKLLANASNFTRGLHVKRPDTQFTCVTCSLLVKAGKFTRVYAASISRRIHANCLQPRVNLPKYNGYFTGNFTCGTHANLPTTSMQKYMQLACKNTRIAGKNIRQTLVKISAKSRQNYHNHRPKYMQFAGKTPAIVGKLDCILLVMLPSTCLLYYMQSRVLCGSATRVDAVLFTCFCR